VQKPEGSKYISFMHLVQPLLSQVSQFGPQSPWVLVVVVVVGGGSGGGSGIFM
jgi:hypothetical protein